MRNSANILTCSRLLAPLILALPLSVEERLAWCVPLAVTDFLDGKLSRWLKLESAIGRVLDPIADKVMTLSILIFIFMQALMDRQIAHWVIVGEVVIAFLVILGIYLLFKEEKRLRMTQTVTDRMSLWKFTIEAYRKIKAELIAVMIVNKFGKGKTFVYFLGGVFVALNTWWPHEFFALSYHVMFIVGLILMLVSFVFYCIDFYHWQKKIT